MAKIRDPYDLEIEEQEKEPRYRLNKRKFFGFIFTILLIGAIAYIGVMLYDGLKNILPALNTENKELSEKSSGSGAGSGVKKNTSGNKLVVLDAGHGGFDSGAIGVSGVHEDELNLKVAKALESLLEKNDFSVMMTRDDDKAIAETKDADMAKRRQIISDSKSDIVVSIHMNSHTDKDTSGPIAFFMPGSVEGEKLAKAIQERLNQDLDPKVKNNPHSEYFYILKSGNQPCVLVECGFISNPQEEALLKDKNYQNKLANAVYKGVMDYFEK